MTMDYVLISWLNDYIFCPYSIYLHNIYGNVDNSIYYTNYQINGKRAHVTIDKHTYSTHKDDLIGIDVFSDKYSVCGKIDIFHKSKKLLVERKRKITTIYDGYRYQLYAQYLALIEMGYDVEQICMHSLIDNKRYFIDIPNEIELKKFENIVQKIKTFNPAIIYNTVTINIEKCTKCIYCNLCDITDFTEAKT
jgi:CRISPR-associated exonuclease Cas4